MGHLQPSSIEEQSSPDDLFRVTLHRHNNPTELLRIFRLFSHDPFKFVDEVSLQTYGSNCWTHSAVRITTIRHTFTLESLAAIKRAHKQGFIEKEIWYVVKAVVAFLAYLQANSLAMGSINLGMFPLEAGRHLKAEVLHLLPDNEHVRVRQIHNYYSPEMIQFLEGNLALDQFDLSKSEVFEFGLMLLELLTCPAAKPKFHNPTLDELLPLHIHKRLQAVMEQRSEKMQQLVTMMLRGDTRTRPDWNYLKIWMSRNEGSIDIAPCVFWAL